MTPTDLSARTGISVPYASQLLSGQRTPSRETAFLIYERTGMQLGHLKGLSKRDCELARRLEGRSAA